MAYVVVALIGALVGLTEIVSRYRDAPLLSVATLGSSIYILVNAIASATALFLLDTFGARLLDGVPAGIQHETMRVLVAGFGALALLRSSLFRIRIDQTDVAIGPAAVLDVLLRVADRDVDRSRALDRAQRIPTLMSTMEARIACAELPALCLALMQNLSAEEQRALGEQIKLIGNDERLSDIGKSVNAGLLLSRFVGYEVLGRAVRSIMERPPDGAVPAPATPVDQVLIDDIKRDLAADRGRAS